MTGRKMNSPLVIDGSSGEGGGQILRSSLTLSIVTGRPIRIDNIRARRPKPGLMRQHLTCVRAAAEISGAEVEGDAVGSRSVSFVPGKVRGGTFKFSIGTAGSTTLVLQTVLLPLLLAEERSTIELEGGTHNTHAPPFDFLLQCFLPLLARMGADVSVELIRPGFYPAGGGAISASVSPLKSLRPIEIMERGKLRRRCIRATTSNLPAHVAERELKTCQRALNWPNDTLSNDVIDGALGPGNTLAVELEHEQVCNVFTAFGELGKSAEFVAKRAARQCQKYLASSAPVGEHLTDQLLLPLAIAGGGQFATTGMSLHATTQVELIRQFLDCPIHVANDDQGTTVVSIGSSLPS